MQKNWLRPVKEIQQITIFYKNNFNKSIMVTNRYIKYFVTLCKEKEEVVRNESSEAI
jgi:hypothetical protein